MTFLNASLVLILDHALSVGDDGSGYEEEADEVEELRVNKTGCLKIVL